MHHKSIVRATSTTFILGVLALVACEDKTATAPKSPAVGTVTDAAVHADHADHAGHADHADGHSGGPVIELGTSQIGPFSTHATRGQGKIVAGKDAPIDVTIAPAAAGDAKAVAVRFWIGLEGGKGSVKAKAEIEDPKEPNRWHTHAEVPNPIATGSKLWVEIETDKGEVVTGSFGLNE